MMRIGEIFAMMGFDQSGAFRPQGPEAKQAFADYLRENQTPTERLMARVLFHIGLEVEPQFPLLGWIVDFYNAEHKAVIEVDGGIHDYQVEADRYRDEKMREAGYKVFRFKAEEVRNLMIRVAEARR